MMDSKVLTHPHVLMNMKNRYLLKMGNTIEWKGYFKQHWYLKIAKFDSKLSKLNGFISMITVLAIGYEISK